MSGGPDLSIVETQALIDELRRRSEVFFCCYRPLIQKDYEWQWSFGGPIGEAFRLVDMARNDSLNPQPDMKSL